MVKKIICDLDNTITIDSSSNDYASKLPNLELIDKLREFSRKGYGIVVFTARNMNTYKGQLEKIEKFTLPVIIEWLEKYDVPYDEVIIGKPWCGDGVYIDDRAIRPSEFINLDEDAILSLVE